MFKQIYHTKNFLIIYYYYSFGFFQKSIFVNLWIFRSGTSLGEAKEINEPLYPDKNESKHGIGYATDRKRRWEDIVREERLEKTKRQENLRDYISKSSEDYKNKKVFKQLLNARSTLRKLEIMELEKKGIELTLQRAHPFYKGIMLEEKLADLEKMKQKKLFSRISLSNAKASQEIDLESAIKEEANSDALYVEFESLEVSIEETKDH